MPISVTAIKAELKAAVMIPPEILKALNEAADRVEDDYHQITKTWYQKPKITKTKEITPSTARIVIGSDDEILEYVTKGTHPHPIWPIRAERLQFRSGYRAKTTPGIVGSTSGGPTGGEVYSVGVMHPGTEPRDFEDAIVEKESPWFRGRMDQAFRDAARRIGGG